ncbi:MAG TPA: hypothetical protein VKE88_00275 [Candidatus Nanoarchaeia archaeon]|nr:hypothetical protein [Candidatus Nanoarchaeia archaeon]
MKKRIIGLTTLLLLLIPLSFAATSHVMVQKLSSQTIISPLGEAAFNILVTNDRAEQDLFFIEVPDVVWSVRTTYAPEYTTGMVMSAYETKNTTLYLKPNKNIAPGTYFVELRVKSQTTKEFDSQIFIVKVDPKFVDYTAVIGTEIIGSTSIDPQKSNSLKIAFKNDEPVYLENVTIETKSRFLNKVSVFDLPPYSEKVVDFTLNIDASTPKQEDTVIITASHANKKVATLETTLFIKEFRLPYKTDIQTTKRFLHTIHNIIFTNTENAQKTQDAAIPAPDSRAYIITSPSAVTEDFDDVSYLVWKGVSLSPDETYTVTVIEDYRPVLGGIIVLLIFIVAYYTFRSPIIIQKKGYGVHKKDTGNNEIKIVIHVKNRSGRFIEQVRVLDRLPVIHKVEPDFGAGTPEPKFRRHGNAEIMLDWDIALAPKEERIFTYKMKSALPIVGEYVLRPVVVQYGKRNRRVTSEAYKLFID